MVPIRSEASGSTALAINVEVVPVFDGFTVLAAGGLFFPDVSATGDVVDGI